MILYALTIFLSAFLLFQVQPVIARIILPWFGGSAAVWTTCMLYFQCVLVLGYLYAHWTTTKLAPRTQALLHSTLIALCVLALPIMPAASWRPTGGDNPIPRILALLTVSVGLPYLLLSTTGPLMQAWFVRSRQGATPYRLFALSNLGSMLALLSYPVLVEPNLATRMQSTVWSAGFLAFGVLCVVTAFTSLKGATTPQAREVMAEQPPPRPGLLMHAMWLALAACASTLLLAVTNHLCQDVASIPFLWVVPLSLYLLTFILCFDAAGWYRRNVFLVLLLIALAGMTYLINPAWDRPKLKYMIPMFAAGFFICCMFCHGELARLKPHPRYLTSFYLMLSVGGALGGLFVGMFAPAVFPAYFEFPIALALCAVLAAVVLHRDESIASHWAWRKSLSTPLLVLATAVVTFNIVDIRGLVEGNLFNGRNFYGALRVQQNGKEGEDDAYRALLHGVINHGEQYLHPSLRTSPSTYYCSETGVGEALNMRARAGRRVGIIGLGTGTLNVYARPWDTFRIYEINPLVVKVAHQYFTYLADTKAKTEIVLGDARQSLEAEQPENFDVLVVDAFSSDSIPVHLLTREAFQLYFHHMKPDGLLAVHVSNRFLNLTPVVDSLARDLHKGAILVDTEDNDDGTCYGTTWIILANDQKQLENLPKKNGEALEHNASLRIWTDDYSNLFQILK
ncbi:MAG: fused MFS/spermidine synthase [Bryobacteraceae bacterium]